jgi:hypothetical protein
VRPALSQLQQRLTTELARPGNTDKTPVSAPSGGANAVFDLAASVIDPDGPPDGQGGGELPPTGIAYRPSGGPIRAAGILRAWRRRGTQSRKRGDVQATSVVLGA